eukprot:Anaeramoba_flamelloidesa568189_70.p1 GENE.a568189_70~~a568189_70.p1  ORF type:complete len:478 (-),score=60.26 a568189_70:10-1443(-)
MDNRFILSLFLLLFLISPTFALIDDYELKTSNQFFRLTTFGFQKGGTIDFEATINSDGQNIWFMACNEKEYTTLSEKKQEEACVNMGSETFICESTSNLEISPFQFNKTVQEEGYRYFVFLNCENDLQTITYKLKYTFMNPNGQYLSLGYIPLPPIYLVFAIVWVLMVIYWFINWFRHLNIKIKLHKYLTFVVIAKCVELFIFYSYWKSLSKNGVQNNTTTYVVYFYDGVYDFFFYLTLLFIAKGYSILKPTFSFKEIKDVVLITMLLVVSSKIEALTGLNILGFICLLVMAISYFVIIRMLFQFTNNHIDQLKRQLALIREAHIHPITTPVYSKYVLFQRYKNSIFVYFLLTIMVYVFKIFFEKSPWFPILAQICVDFFLFVGIGLTFRLRKFNQLFHEPPRMQGTFNQPTEGYEAIDSELDDDNLQEWIQGMPLPRWDHDEEINEENVVMIENIGEEKKIDLGQQENQEKEEINK